MTSDFVVSAHFKGKQMVDVFNSLNVKVSCLGNHDLDHSLAKMIDLTGKTKPCKWLISNLTEEKTGKPVGGLERWIVEEVEANGGKLRIGFFGLAEKEWLGCFTSLVTEKFIYTDFVETAKELTTFLR